MKGTHARAARARTRPLYSANRLGLYEGRARSVYTVPTGWDCMKGARARSSCSDGEEDNHDDHND